MYCGNLHSSHSPCEDVVVDHLLAVELKMRDGDVLEGGMEGRKVCVCECVRRGWRGGSVKKRERRERHVCEG